VRVYLDADIVIWQLRRLQQARQLLDALLEQEDVELWLAAMQRAEVVFHIRDREEARTMELLSLFRTHPVTEEIVDLAATYFRRWNPSHGVDENDAILAATVALTGGKVVTQNTRHFPMTEIVVERGWD
jgi:predicted nucleic acid-binding protein